MNTSRILVQAVCELQIVRNEQGVINKCIMKTMGIEVEGTMVIK